MNFFFEFFERGNRDKGFLAGSELNAISVRPFGLSGVAPRKGVEECLCVCESVCVLDKEWMRERVCGMYMRERESDSKCDGLCIFSAVVVAAVVVAASADVGAVAI